MTDCLLETLQKPARWDHPTGPPNARSVAVAADRTEGGMMIEGVGEDSGESEWWVAGVGDGCEIMRRKGEKKGILEGLVASR